LAGRVPLKIIYLIVRLVAALAVLVLRRDTDDHPALRLVLAHRCSSQASRLLAPRRQGSPGASRPVSPIPGTVAIYRLLC
jgi:hypothetical protein